MVLSLQNRAKANGKQMKCCRMDKDDRSKTYAPEGTRDWNSDGCDYSIEGRVRLCYNSGKIKRMEKRMYDILQIDCKHSDRYKSAWKTKPYYEIDGFKDCKDLVKNKKGRCAKHKDRCESDHDMISDEGNTFKSEHQKKLQRRHTGLYQIEPAQNYLSVCDYFTERIHHTGHETYKPFPPGEANKEPQPKKEVPRSATITYYDQECTDPNTHEVNCYFEQCMNSNCDVDEATQASCNVTELTESDVCEHGCACNEGYCRRSRYGQCFPCSECGKPEENAADLYEMSMMSIQGTDEVSIAQRTASNGHECYPTNGAYIKDAGENGMNFISRFETAFKNDQDVISGNSHCNPKYGELSRPNALLNIDTTAYGCTEIERKAQIKMHEFGFNKYIKVFNAIYVFWPSQIGNVKGPEIARLLSSVLDSDGVGRISDKKERNLNKIVGDPMRERFAHIILCDNNDKKNTACNKYHHATTGFKAWAAGKASKKGLRTKERLKYSKMADVSPFNTLQVKDIFLTDIGGEEDLRIVLKLTRSH